MMIAGAGKRGGTEIIVRAPVRISFGGGGTDLAAYYRRFGGFVVSAAITCYCHAAARRASDGGIHLRSHDYGLVQHFRWGTIPAVEEPLSLVKAAIEWFADRGLREIGVDLSTGADVPPGTGLGSSSAMAVSVVQALAASVGREMGVGEIADLACRLEIERLGMPIGKQDQYASAFGGLNAITFTTSGVEVEPIALPSDVRAGLNARLLLFSTGRSRHSGSVLGRQQAESATNPAVIASLHRLKDLAYAMRDALEATDLDGFGRLLDQAWQHKKGLSGAISSGQIDRWYEAARRAGALGGKITGAGGGGFLLLYCPPNRQERLRAVMAACGLRELVFALDPAGVQIVAPAGTPAARLAHGVGRRDGTGLSVPTARGRATWSRG